MNKQLQTLSVFWWWLICVFPLCYVTERRRIEVTSLFLCVSGNPFSAGGTAARGIGRTAAVQRMTSGRTVERPHDASVIQTARKQPHTHWQSIHLRAFRHDWQLNRRPCHLSLHLFIHVGLCCSADLQQTSTAFTARWTSPRDNTWVTLSKLHDSNTLKYWK